MITDLAKDYLAGVAGGVAVVLIGHPFDTVKTRLQTSPSGVYMGTIDCLKQTINNEGVKGFYTGIGAFRSNLQIPYLYCFRGRFGDSHHAMEV